MDYLANIFGFNDETTDFLKNVPKFSIQSLIDKLPGEHFDTNDFFSDSITAKHLLNSFARNSPKTNSLCYT